MTRSQEIKTPDVRDAVDEELDWLRRRHLPSELAQKPWWTWPGDVSLALDVGEQVLKQMRAAGDHPRLVAIGRKLVTKNPEWVDEWLATHELAAGAKLRPATIPRGSKLNRSSASAGKTTGTVANTGKKNAGKRSSKTEVPA